MMKEVRISYAESWQRIHCMAIKTAYSRSPYYEYFAEELNAILLFRFEFLYELNQALMNALLHFIGINKNLSAGSGEVNLFSEKTSEQHQSEKFRPYNQVFSYKLAFQPDLSIIDLVFNMGRQSISYLTSLNEN